jgi:hypothetical protein
VGYEEDLVGVEALQPCRAWGALFAFFAGMAESERADIREKSLEGQARRRRSRCAEPSEGHVLAGFEAEPLVEGDRVGVGLGHVQEGTFVASGDTRDERSDQA